MPFSVDMIFLAAVVGLLTSAALDDFRGQIIPSWIGGAIAGLFGLYCLLGSKSLAVHWHVATAVVVLAVAFAAQARGLMGPDAAKLIGSVAVWVGPEQIGPMLLLMGLSGAILAFSASAGAVGAGSGDAGGRANDKAGPLPRWRKKGAVPYGIAICVGGLLTVPSVIV